MAVSLSASEVGAEVTWPLLLLLLLLASPDFYSRSALSLFSEDDERVPCESYEYDTSFYTSTISTDWDLVSAEKFC